MPSIVTRKHWIISFMILLEFMELLLRILLFETELGQLETI